MHHTFTFHSDPGHGWLEAPKALIRELGIAGKVSRYSYQSGATAFLEEDCDAPLLLRALEARGDTFTLDDKYREHCPIRWYQEFSGK